MPSKIFRLNLDISTGYLSPWDAKIADFYKKCSQSNTFVIKTRKERV